MLVAAPDPTRAAALPLEQISAALHRARQRKVASKATQIQAGATR